MLDREPFLRAIFATPDDDLPRLVFADYLEEHGDAGWAELIRVQCELARLADDDPRRKDLTAREWAARRTMPAPADDPTCLGFEGVQRVRGFRPEPWIHVVADQLGDPDAFRLTAVRDHPEWYGATELKVTSGRITSPDQLATILTSPVTEHVTKLDLSGQVLEHAVEIDDPDDAAHLSVFDIEYKPVIPPRMIEALAGMRECRRLTDLDLRNNDLHSDAARALAASPHFYRLRRLALVEGNRMRGRTWQQVIARFGPDVAQ
jgi:uncharacterized protein (TIGR02996 family)